MRQYGTLHNPTQNLWIDGRNIPQKIDTGQSRPKRLGGGLFGHLGQSLIIDSVAKSLISYGIERFVAIRDYGFEACHLSDFPVFLAAKYSEQAKILEAMMWCNYSRLWCVS
jgi:hypothetical protein